MTRCTSGNRHSRVRGERYDQLINAYIETASRLFPNALLHFEDFGPSNARRILEQYRDKAPVFNDDVQGTGAITLAGDSGRDACRRHATERAAGGDLRRREQPASGSLTRSGR